MEALLRVDVARVDAQALLACQRVLRLSVVALSVGQAERHETQPIGKVANLLSRLTDEIIRA